MPFKRTTKSQRRHDRMVFFIAVDLARSGFIVTADHINWPNGSPEAVNDYVPDIVAEKDGKILIFEVETCSTLNNLQTIRQLTAFSRAAATYVMIPTSCQDSIGDIFCPLSRMRGLMKEWHIPITQIGTCNHLTREIHYNPQ